MLLKKAKKEEPKVEKEKIVVLNSGGFDSVVMMNCLHLTEPDKELHSIHFLYGALNEAQQQECVDKVCEKCGAKNIVINLPNFSWTKSDFFGETNLHDSQYLEYRNLIFIAYALSYAESIGAKRIYVAVLAGSTYNDTNPIFFKGLNSFTQKNSGIEICTPFETLTKYDLVTYAVQSKMEITDFFSCDTPDENGNPCGKCCDCKIVEDIKSILKVDTPIKALIHAGYNFGDEKFKRLLSEQPIEEVRALINNDCQMQCEHCFYGFDNMKGKALSREQYYSVLKDFVLNHGVKNIHFSGKEPLFDDSIVWYAEQIHKDKLPCTFNLVTNGINIPKYIDDLKKYGVEHIALSVDDVLDTNGVRSVHGVTDKALKACNKAGVKVEVFIDLHENNYDKVDEIVNFLNRKYLVNKFFFRTIRNIGHAEKSDSLVALTGKQLDDAWTLVKGCAKQYQKKEFEFTISIEYLPEIQGTTLMQDIDACESTYSCQFTSNCSLMVEEFCHRYSGTYTLTPDGYLLGCASEVSCPNYDEVSIGNVKDLLLIELIERGKEEAYRCNDHYLKENCLECSCKNL